MRFFNSVVISASALVAFVAAATSPIQFTDAPRGSINAGDSFTLKYTGDENIPATILLKKGPTNQLVTISTITTDATGGSFKWTVPKDIAPGGDYALQIIAGTDNNYWSIGAIAGGTAASTTATSASASSASSALSSASSKISSLSSKLSSATVTSAGTTTATSTGNSTTVTKPTLTSSSTSGSSSTSTSGTSTTSSGGAAPSDSNGGAAGLKSNAALVLGAVAAMAYLG